MQYDELEELSIVTRKVTRIPLNDLGDWEKEPLIRKFPMKTANANSSSKSVFDPESTDYPKFLAAVEEQIVPVQKKHPDYLISVRNSNEEADEAKEWAIKVFTVCVFLILLVLAIILRSIIWPMLVGISIPMGIIGIIWLLFLRL